MYNCHDDMYDSMDSEVDRSEIIIRIEVSLKRGHSKIDNVEPNSSRNDGINKVNKLFHHEVCEM